MSGVREWVAVEKVHGAHFAVVCDGTGVRPAKRRELLGDDALDGFFGVSRIWPVLSVAAARFASALHGSWGDAAMVTVYGELAGGSYPHPDVPAIAGAEPVQTGVWYAPGLQWLPFDASVETAEGRRWISDRALRDAAAAAGLVCPPALGNGALNKLQDLPCAFPTRVPALFELPELADNLAEGYVLKPADEWSETKAACTGIRPVVKVKQKSFAEDERFDGARPYLPPPQGAAGVPAWLLAQASALLTPARAAAVVSKLGPRTPVDAVAEEITRDVSEELAEALGGLEDTLLRPLERALLPGARSLAVFDAKDRHRSRTGGRGTR
ncbi:RNA ligase family protein [Streptomyces europaeiscabiei]|uniref:RNA ligase family protein n=1 Tax=Streptomyces europaeiscabiei TaxID=146819 RepID=UPI0029B407CD|nr:RNA ligase family protein [Streptomyces europaeiscabiei]MDX3612154.1 RNA ligase family protein [Streptomyces europaeiscabiei]MDX3630385.1 RNA ligase family protein [Streptomyces europaeiscabiei]MDX3648522.1 RNA ligase family protein [Streptomyces europaeiscabiei]